MFNFKHILPLAVVLTAGFAWRASAQTIPPTVHATIEPDTILIGDRFTISIDVERDMMQVVGFPTFGEGDTSDEEGKEPSVECISIEAEDTLLVEGRRMHLRKRYNMTAYDEGRYALGKVKVLYLDKNIVDTLYSPEDLSLTVHTFQIDSTAQGIFDIKPQKTLPLRFGEFSGYLFGGIAALLLLAGMVVGLVWWLQRHGRKITDIFRPAPPIPPHIVAITALEALHNQKLWQNNKHKLYYSSLSDILRTYLSGQFGVGAMEMTTDEIADAMRSLDLPQKSSMEFIEVLRDADLVKFAKATPDADENESAYNKAYYFVEETKPVEPTEENTEEEKR